MYTLPLQCHGTVVSQRLRDRVGAWQEYKRRHGVDVRPLLQESGWMSGEESNLQNVTQEEQDTHIKRLQEAALLSPQDIKAGVPVWERIRPGWRTDEVRQRTRLLFSVKH